MSGLCETIILTAGLLALGCAVAQPAGGGHAPTEEWQKVEVKGRFSFSIPPDIKRTSAAGTDSLVGEYRGANVSLGFDYGWYSDPLEYRGKTNYQESSIEIDGRRAKLVTFRRTGGPNDFANFAGIHFADLGDEQNKLTMWAGYHNEADLDQVKKIFQSIKFL